MSDKFSVGDKVYIGSGSGHPWKWHSGTVVCYTDLPVIGRRVKVRLDHVDGVPPGHECFVKESDLGVNNRIVPK